MSKYLEKLTSMVKAFNDIHIPDKNLGQRVMIHTDNSLIIFKILNENQYEFVNTIGNLIVGHRSYSNVNYKQVINILKEIAQNMTIYSVEVPDKNYRNVYYYQEINAPQVVDAQPRNRRRWRRRRQRRPRVSFGYNIISYLKTF
jgi:hypothetical protein